MEPKGRLLEDLDDLDLEDDHELEDIWQLDPNTPIKDEQDLHMLNSLSELERETILARRKQKIEKLRERIEIRHMIKKRMESMKSGPPGLARGGSTRPCEHRSKEHLLVESRYIAGRLSPPMRPGFDRSRPPSAPYHEGLEQYKRTAPPPSFNQVQSLQVTRLEISEWIFAPFFDKTLKGCFLRFCIESGGTNKSPAYKVVRVLDVRTSRQPYNIGNCMVDKCALLKIGTVESVQNFDIVSNSPITQHEYRQWLVDVEASGTGYVTQDLILEKTAELARARGHNWSNDELNFRLEKKRALEVIPRNIPAQVIQLRNLYQQTADPSRREDIKERLDGLIRIMRKKRISDSRSSSEERTGQEHTQPRPSPYRSDAPNHTSTEQRSTPDMAGDDLPPGKKTVPHGDCPAVPRRVAGTPAPTLTPTPNLASCIEISSHIGITAAELERLTGHTLKDSTTVDVNVPT